MKNLNNEQDKLWESYTESVATKKNLHSAKKQLKAAMSHEPKLPTDELLSLHKYVEMLERIVNGEKVTAVSEKNPQIAAKRSRILNFLRKWKTSS